MGKTDCHVETVIEIERRFPFDAQTENKLKSAGASLLSEKSFTDTYYDTADYRLTGSDHWLRSRDGKWQLKYASPVRLSETAAEYVEIEEEDAILDILSKHLDQPEISLARMGCLEAFCTFRTTRKKYCLSSGVVVDLDSTDFGFAIGEMEILVTKTGDEERDFQNHENAIKTLDETAMSLGIAFNSNRMAGKVTTFMKRNAKNHYEFLMNKGVLKVKFNDEP